MNTFIKLVGYVRGLLLRRKITINGFVQSIGKTIVVNNGVKLL